MENQSSLSSSFAVGQYVIAKNLIGFRSDNLRVKIERIDGSNIFIITADLADAGTRLVLDIEKIEALQPETDLFHKTGLISF